MSWFKKVKRFLGTSREISSITINGIEIEDFNLTPDMFKTIYMGKDVWFKTLTSFDVVVTWKEWDDEQIAKFTIPEGYEWDGASIPKIATPFIGRKTDKSFALASMLHDFITDPDGDLFDHYIESRIFYRVLKTRKGKLDIPKWKEDAMFAAVFLWSIATTGR